MNQHHLSRFDDAIPTTLGAVVRPVEQPKPAPVPASHFVEAIEIMDSDAPARPKRYYTQCTMNDPLGQVIHDATIRPPVNDWGLGWITKEEAVRRQVQKAEYDAQMVKIANQGKQLEAEVRSHYGIRDPGKSTSMRQVLEAQERQKTALLKQQMQALAFRPPMPIFVNRALDEEAMSALQPGKIWYDEAADISPNAWETLAYKPGSPSKPADTVVFRRWTSPSQREQDAKNTAMAAAAFEAGFSSVHSDGKGTLTLQAAAAALEPADGDLVYSFKGRDWTITNASGARVNMVEKRYDGGEVPPLTHSVDREELMKHIESNENCPF